MDAPRKTPPLCRLSAAQIVAGVAAGEFSVTEVIDQYAARIEAVNPQINALVYPLLDAARETAQAYDAAGRPSEPGLLHGAPFTVKECFYVQGAPATIGLTNQLTLSPQDGPHVQRMRAAGAIPLGVTNVPQLMILHETDNPVYGRTNNPWNLEHGVGGSSGGEAAIIAAGASPLGLGSDLGGSIRLPAHFCGVHGIKPTNRRLARTGAFDNLRGMQGLEYQTGPLASHVEDLELALRVLASAEHGWRHGDVGPIPMTPSRDVDLSQLRIGYWEYDGYFQAAPAIRRVVRESIAALKESGAQLIELRPPNISKALQHYFAIISADGGADFRNLLTGSKKDAEVARIVRLAQTPRWIRPLMAALLRMRGERKLADLFVAAGPRSATSLWQATAGAIDFVDEVQHTWDDERIDAVITPPHALPAFLHGMAVELIPSASYSLLFNLLGVPCGTVACSRVGEDELSDRTVLSDPVERSAQQVELASAGMPVGLQVAGRPWREDQVLAIMGKIESYFRQRDDYPDVTRLPI
ncbi:amidase [Blastopirellula sp. JC732]|uniref:Amidase n=1 Tax=Blastopirellula sediminis TaxID=2894196 RepID=A0A9X1MI37_9BACT|nr:amidase family protein [Blastopirellula sediminis]MCC9609616.1 amidase [Blastopirellula sediminis]MCC9627608.1 amidase [Blastopirellula sediminis]